MDTHPAEAWKRLGACRGLDPALFFDEDQTLAKEVCRTCPVEGECLEYALEIEEWVGTWGGMTGKERQAEADRRRRKGET